MNKEEITKRILSVLNERKTGLKNKKLMGLLNIKTRTTESRRYYNVLKGLESEKLGPDRKIERIPKGVKGETLIYLQKNRDEAWETWNIYGDSILNKTKKIKGGFALIEQGVITQRRGAWLPYKDYVLDSSHTDLLDKLDGIPDNSDFLFWWIENYNNNAIEGVTARIYLVPVFYQPQADGKCHKCRYDVDYGNILITVDKLLAAEKKMPNDRAYAIIPVKRKNRPLENDVDNAELTPRVKIWYKDNSIRYIRGGKVTSDTSKGTILFLMSE